MRKSKIRLPTSFFIEPLFISIPLFFGLFSCGYCLALPSWQSQIANTMAIAISVTLLINMPGLSQVDIVLARFINVIYGISVAFLVMALADVIRKKIDPDEERVI